MVLSSPIGESAVILRYYELCLILLSRKYKHHENECHDESTSFQRDSMCLRDRGNVRATKLHSYFRAVLNSLFEYHAKEKRTGCC